jgi:hypothetical protein
LQASFCRDMRRCIARSENFGSQGTFGLSESRAEIGSKRFGGVAIVMFVDGHALYRRLSCDSKLRLLLAHHYMAGKELLIEWSWRAIDLQYSAFHA